jgi:WD40 repeat protein
MALSPNSWRLASGDIGGTIRVWALRMENLIELARRTAGGELSEEDRGFAPLSEPSPRAASAPAP